MLAHNTPIHWCSIAGRSLDRCVGNVSCRLKSWRSEIKERKVLESGSGHVASEKMRQVGWVV
jgi:hypothetical protein